MFGDVIADELERGEFVGTGGLLDGAAERGELAFDLVTRQQVHSSGEDRSFENGVLRAIEAEEISQVSDVDNSRADFRAFLRGVERFDFKLVPAAGGSEDSAGDFFSGECFRLRSELSDRCFSQQQDVINDVKHSVRSLLQVSKSL